MPRRSRLQYVSFHENSMTGDTPDGDPLPHQHTFRRRKWRGGTPKVRSGQCRKFWSGFGQVSVGNTSCRKGEGGTPQGCLGSCRNGLGYLPPPLFGPCRKGGVPYSRVPRHELLYIHSACEAKRFAKYGPHQLVQGLLGTSSSAT